MTIDELDQALPVTDGAVTLTASTLGGLLSAFLGSANDNNPLIIASAEKTVGANEVTVDGTASLLHVLNAPIRAVFTIQPDGSVAPLLRWTLPDTWTFASSFPTLPSFDDPTNASSASLLNDLQLTASAFVVTNAGLSVTAQITPSGVFGIFQTLAGSSPLTLTAPITFADTTVATPPLPPMTLPWQMTPPVPGILITVPFATDLTIGTLQMSAVSLKIYSPTDTAWLTANATYTPVLAVTATLAVPSANITADVSATFPASGSSAIFDCNFAGVTIDKLAQLTDLVGGSDLASILPPQVSGALASIAVERASLGVVGTLSPAGLQYVALTVGLPDVSWNVLETPVPITLSDLAASFLIASPLTSGRSLAVSVMGNVDLAGATFSAYTGYPGFNTSLELAPGTTVQLQHVFSVLAPSLTPAELPELTFEMLQLAVTPGEGFAFSARMADAPPWTIAAGPASMSIVSGAVDVATSSGPASASFSGTLEFGGGIEIAARYDVPGSFTIRGDFPEIHLSDLIKQLDSIGVPMPAGFEIDLQQAYALIEEQNTAFTFSAAALVPGTGLFALTAEKSSAWGFAAGVQLGNGSSVSSMPGLGALAAFESFVGLEEVLIVVSSLDEPGFSFPDMAAFDAPPLAGHSISLPPQANGVVRGFNLYAKLSAATNAGFQLLANFLGVKIDGSVGITLSVSAPDPATSSKLFLSVDTTINDVTKLAGKLGVLLLKGEPGAFLSGALTTSLQGQPVTFDVTAIVLPTGALISGTMAGQIHFTPVTLGNVAVVIGLDEAGVPSLGFAATIDVSDFDSSIAIFFDSTNPSDSMFAGAVSDVTLLTIATAIAGQGSVPSPLDQALAAFALAGIGSFTTPASDAAVAALNGRDLAAIRALFAQGSVTLPTADDQIFFVVNTAGSVWHLTDLSTMLHYELNVSGENIDVALEPQFYCAPQATQIGALTYPQGIHVIAEIDAFLVKAQIKIEISPSTGIAVDAGLAPIDLVSSNVFSLTGTSPNGGPLLSMATFSQPQQSDPRLQPPHFLLTGTLHVLGVDVESIYVSISAQGLAFEISQTSFAVQYDLQGAVTAAPALSVNGTAVLGLDESFDAGPLGTVHVTATVNGTIGVAAGATGASASFQGGFDFEGLSYEIPPVSLDVSGPALANLAATVWQQVIDAITKALQDVARYIEFVKDQIITYAGDAAQVAEAVGAALKNTYNQAGDAIVNLTKETLGYTLDGVTAALKGAGVAAEDAANLLVSAGYEAANIADAITGIFTGSTHIDFSFGHADVAAGPHVDTPFVPHLDTPGAPHVDTPGAPHADVGSVHSDWSTHVDHGTFLGHWDTSIGHFDHAVTPHIDTPVYPHIDTPLYPHVDTPSELHVDGPMTPHVDRGTHADT